jgi:two-component system KDP operon response regulator KdpE
VTAGSRILVVDDERALRSFVSRNLGARGFDVVTARSGFEALAAVRKQALDLVILDVMMPTMDGYETCRRIRQQSLVPIIVLTALGEGRDRVTALEHGADDCLTKPFGVDELLARVRACLRRVRWDQQDPARRLLQYRDLVVDQQARRATLRGSPLKLTATEFNLLRVLMEHPGETLPHRMLLQGAWGEEYGEEAEYLRVYIGRLRRKIEDDPADPEYLFTDHGIGYRFGT